MSYNEALAARVRGLLAKRPGITEKKMFGGVGFLLNGNMCCGVHGEELIVRLAPENTESALAEPHTRIFDLSGRPMKNGWILVQPPGLKDDKALSRWVRVGAEFASTLPKK